MISRLLRRALPLLVFGSIALSSCVVHEHDRGRGYGHRDQDHRYDRGHGRYDRGYGYGRH